MLCANIHATITSRMAATPGIAKTLFTASREEARWPGASGTTATVSARVTIAKTDSATNA